MPNIRRLSVRGILVLWILAAILVGAAVAALLLRQEALVGQTRAALLHAHEVRDYVEAALSKIKDAVLHQRNYIISKNDVFLESYHESVRPVSGPHDTPHPPAYRRSINESIEHLAFLTTDNPVQSRHVVSLRQSARALLDYLAEMIRLRQRDDPAVLAVPNVLRGREFLSQVRQASHAMLEEETRLLNLRSADDAAATRQNSQLVMTVVAIFYMASLGLAWQLRAQWTQAKVLERQAVLRAQEVDSANEKLRQANGALEALNKKIEEGGQARLRAVVDNALDGLITINAQGLIESFNPACERIFGYKAEEVLGQNIKILMPEPYHSAHDGYIKHYCETGKAAIIGTAGREVSAQRKDGSVFPMDLSISAFWLDGEQHFSGILRDITKRKEAEAGLLHYTRELEHSNQELDDFAYIASHDLKEPLRGLFNHASFLLEDYRDKLDADGQRRLQRLLHLTQRMERLVNDLLYFSRLGRSALAIQLTDPNKIVREIEQMMEVFLKEHNARIILPAAMPAVICDKPRVTEVFRNLITNAVKYSDKPERLVEVGFHAAMNSPQGVEKNVFYVKDNGIGIDPAFHQEIFRIFKRLNVENGDEKGTGVGLTFVKKIIERHQGQIWLDSAPGQGTIFFFTLGQGEITHDKQHLA